MLFPAKRPKRRHVQIPKGYTSLGFIKSDGESNTIRIGEKFLVIRAQKRTNVAPGLSRVNFQGLLYVAHAERVYLFLGAPVARMGEGVFSLADPLKGNVLVNVAIKARL